MQTVIYIEICCDLIKSNATHTLKFKEHSTSRLEGIVTHLALKLRPAKSHAEALQWFTNEFQLEHRGTPMTLQDIYAAFGMTTANESYRIDAVRRRQYQSSSVASSATPKTASTEVEKLKDYVMVEISRANHKSSRIAMRETASFKNAFAKYQSKFPDEKFVFMHGRVKINSWNTARDVQMFKNHDYALEALTLDEYELRNNQQVEAKKKSKPEIVLIGSDSDSDDEVQYVGQSSAIKRRQLTSDDMEPQEFKKPAVELPGFRTALDDLRLKSLVSEAAMNDARQKLLDEQIKRQMYESKPEHKAMPGIGVTQEFGPNGHDIEDKEVVEHLEELLDSFNPQYPPEKRMPTPREMKIELKPYQRIGLSWMTDMERGKTQGGMLCDKMGLGKSCQTIATILANPPPPQSTTGRSLDSDDDGDEYQDGNDVFVKDKVPTKSLKERKTATLIVLPLALVSQWKDEFRKFVKAAHQLRMLVYHGDFLTPNERKSFERHPELLCEYDIVFATYQGVAGQFVFSKDDLKVYNQGKFHLDRDAKNVGPFFKINWWRIVLDEAHQIKNKNARSSIALAYLLAERRWCLTGTPIQNKSDDLYALFRFLRINPYRHWTRFQSDLSVDARSQAQRDRIHGNENERMRKLQAVLQIVMLRRTKDSRIDDSDQPIVSLPIKEFHEYTPEFSQQERELYDEFEAGALQQFKQFENELSYAHIFGMITRMRQLCLHYTLATQGKTLEDNLMTDELKLEDLINRLSDDVMKRLRDYATGAVSIGECHTCLQFIEAPIATMCGHISCLECITEYIQSKEEDGGEIVCPMCREQIKKTQLIPLKFIKKQVDPVAFEREALEQALAAQNRYIKSTKITSLIQLLDQIAKENSTDKVIIFCSFTSMLDLIQPALKQAQKSYVRIDGTMKIKDRCIAIERLRTDASCKILLASLKAGCVGLNLTMANHVILLDLWWNPAIQNQAIDRIHRIGQLKDQVHVHIITIPKTIEDRIKLLQEEKQKLADNALGEGDGSAGTNARLTRQDLVFLFTGRRPR